MELAKWYVFVQKRTGRVITVCIVGDYPFCNKVKVRTEKEPKLPWYDYSYMTTYNGFSKEFLPYYDMIGEL